MTRRPEGSCERPTRMRYRWITSTRYPMTVGKRRIALPRRWNASAELSGVFARHGIEIAEQNKTMAGHGMAIRQRRIEIAERGTVIWQPRMEIPD
jgi:hypothetical protein